MLETLQVLPVSFWVAICLLLAGGIWAVMHIREGIGLPVLAVLGTVAAWYVGDAFYNNYAQNLAPMFSPTVLENAWWQVAGFLIVFLVLTPLIHSGMNRQWQFSSSRMFQLIQTGGDPQFQAMLDRTFWGTVAIWLGLMFIAILRLGDHTIYYFFPFLGERADPWARGTIGGGISALLSLASNVQLFLVAIFGLVAALARNPMVRSLALIACCLTWPNYIFDRVRNSMLVIILPALLSYVFIRMRKGWLTKIAMLVVGLLLFNAWFAFIIANRDDSTITAAAKGNGTSLKEANKEAHHEGMNMFEELCWANTLIEVGILKVKPGANYFANLANPIPRGLWKNKPTIGLDYALARGQEYSDDGITATISTGLIGQGVVNFGPLAGPVFAAWLMAMWAAFLARLDLRGNQVGYFCLFQLGIVETFNLGRDITFIALYPVFFGLLIVWWMNRWQSKSTKRQSEKFKTWNPK